MPKTFFPAAESTSQMLGPRRLDAFGSDSSYVPGFRSIKPKMPCLPGLRAVA